jgi:hypothetical protein
MQSLLVNAEIDTGLAANAIMSNIACSSSVAGKRLVVVIILHGISARVQETCESGDTGLAASADLQDPRYAS